MFSRFGFAHKILPFIQQSLFYSSSIVSTNFSVTGWSMYAKWKIAHSAIKSSREVICRCGKPQQKICKSNKCKQAAFYYNICQLKLPLEMVKWNFTLHKEAKYYILYQLLLLFYVHKIIRIRKEVMYFNECSTYCMTVFMISIAYLHSCLHTQYTLRESPAEIWKGLFWVITAPLHLLWLSLQQNQTYTESVLTWKLRWKQQKIADSKPSVNPFWHFLTFTKQLISKCIYVN